MDAKVYGKVYDCSSQHTVSIAKRSQKLQKKYAAAEKWKKDRNITVRPLLEVAYLL